MRCEYTLSWPLYRGWVLRDRLRGGQLVLDLLLTLFGAVNLFLAIPFSLLTITQLSLAALCVYAVFFHWRISARNRYRQIARSCGGENWVRVITFGEDAVTFTDGPFTKSLKYAHLTGIREKPDQVTLLFGKRDRLILLPNSFTRGSWPQCREFLERNMAK